MQLPDFRTQLQKDAESYLQGVGRNQRVNYQNFKKRWKNKSDTSVKHYDTYNPFKKY